jgi:peptide deformylase
MTVLTVLHYPDERLRTVAQAVPAVTAEIKQLVKDMLDTMYDENGIGLAATQVNVHKRVVVIDISENRDEPMVFINPEIIAKSGDTEYEEGCLSVPL